LNLTVTVLAADTQMRMQIRVTGMAETKDVALTSNSTNLLRTALACAVLCSQAEEQSISLPFAQKQDTGDWIDITPTALGYVASQPFEA
jgi:hypothetical protein